MKRVYQSNLSHGQLRHLIAQLRRYRDDELPKKHREFIERLAEIGIVEANVRTEGTRYVDYVAFETEYVKNTKKQKVLLVFGRDKEMMERTWYSFHGREGERNAQVNPILMLEFGSGKHAQPGWRGTFPNQHTAFLQYWDWYEYPDGTTDVQNTELVKTFEDGMEWRRSEGEVPRMPVQGAYEKMAQSIVTIANEVFG